MSDREKSTLPLGNESELFRRTLLWRVKNPEHVAALHWLNDLFYDWLNCGGQFGDTQETLTVASLRAAVADLEGVAEYLDSVAYTLEDSTVSPEDARLCVRASKWARKTRRLAADIEAKLGPSPAPLEAA